MPTILTDTDLPAAELQAGVLDGELVRVGGAFCTSDTVIGIQQRAAAISAEVTPWSIAERFTAAWVYGVIDREPPRLQLCVNQERKVRPFSTPRLVYREVVIGAHDVRLVGGLTVTTPLRTALDIVRIEQQFSEESHRIVRELSDIGDGFNVKDCAAKLNARTNLPHKKAALKRLAIIFG